MDDQRVEQVARKRRVYSITWVVGTAFGLLIGVSMLLVLGLAVSANMQNTFSLLNDKAVLTTNSLERRLRDHLDLASQAVVQLKTVFDERELGDRLEDLRGELIAAVHANPSLDALVVNDAAGDGFGIYRSPTGKLWPFRRQQIPEEARLYALPQMTANSPATWGPLVTSGGMLYANVTVPLVRGGTLIGYLTAAVSIDELGRTVRQLDEGEHSTVFIIANGNEVIAHSDIEDFAAPGGEVPRLPVTIEQLGDRALARLATSKPMENFQQASAAGVEVRDLDNDDGGPDYLSMTKVIAGYGPGVWTVGQYYVASSISREVQRLFGSAIVGLLSILLAIGLSVLLVRRATRPLAEISRQARFVGELDFDKVEHLPRNMVREIDQVFQAFNAMVSGLRAMNTYVPRSLFRKLMRLGVDKAAVASERDLTFIFTDIVGFTSMSENLTAAQTADILNEHFALLVAAVEREGGTVDKFIGDGMLAFWGAPDERADHALAAARACLGIAAALREGNAQALANGGKMVRMRIGLHTGRVVVGNVGALDRWNYTVVGDAVNLCERLQSFGRDVAPQDEMVILASDTAVSRIQAQSGGMIAAGAARKVGTHRLRGRSEAIAVWRLDDAVDPEHLCIPGSGIDLAG
ncbi:adenylate/guanylate cyclase domain-containing protein [Stappia indica]|uniref:adenylate/guanylate cyclase domain-containing protein n=1 Tax=Stappia indica TaxID=538381 RepID=UPI0008366C7A|nr:adenylate/guanylate cyclase domain-containing protein [Stappia indica]